MPLERPAYPLRLSLDVAALANNWRALDRLSGQARAGAAVKANAYGLGARRVVPVLWEAGCRQFFVAHWAEAADLLDLLPPANIAVLHGPMSVADAVYARSTRLRPVLNSLAQVQHWHAAGGGPCDLMVDTGINRLGLALSDLADPAVAALDVDTLHSHLASAETQSPQNELQRSRWVEACLQVPHRAASLANSAGIMRGEGYHGQLTRPGLALYGGVPCAALAPYIRQVAQPETQLIQRRTLRAGESVGYNAQYTAAADMEVGVVSLGYADGYLRGWSGMGVMHADGQPLPVLGRVSRDMTVIDLGAAPDLREGDWVSADYALPAAAAASGLSQYELLTLLGARFVR